MLNALTNQRHDLPNRGIRQPAPRTTGTGRLAAYSQRTLHMPKELMRWLDR